MEVLEEEEDLSPSPSVEVISEEPFYGLDDIERTIQDNPEFHKNPIAQLVQFMELRRHWHWKNVPLATKRDITQRFTGRFPRCVEAPHPQETFRRIMELPEDDVNRALQVRQADFVDYRPEPGEHIYSTVEGWLGDYLDHCKYNEVPLAFHFWSAMSVLGAACRRNYYIDIGADEVQLNQYIILTGEKATGKSTAMKLGLRVLQRMNRQFSEQKLHAQIADDRTFKVGIFPQDVTQEHLVSALAQLSGRETLFKYQDGRSGMKRGEACAVIAADEFSNFAGNEVYNAQKRITFLVTAAFDDRYSKATKGGGEEIIERMTLSLLSTTQPGWMRNTITSDALEGGFIERVLFIHREETRRLYSMYRIPKVDPLVAEILAERLQPLATSNGTMVRTCLMPTKEAESIIHTWYLQETSRRRAGTSGEIDKQSIHRRGIHINRTAALLAISEGDSLPYMEARHMNLAMEIIQAEDVWYTQFLEQAQEGTLEGQKRKVMDFLRSDKVGGSIPKTDFGQAKPFRSWGSKVRDTIVAELADTGELTLDRQGKVLVINLVRRP